MDDEILPVLELERISPLGSVRGDLNSVPIWRLEERVCVRELPFGLHHVLRFDPARVRIAGELKLPERPNTSVIGPFGLLAWVGPDEWWLWSGERRPKMPCRRGLALGNFLSAE